MARPVHEIADLLPSHPDRALPAGAAIPSQTDLFVVTRAVDSVIRSAPDEASPVLESRTSEDEIPKLVRGYFAIP
ncbi:hypothetical protein [Tistlia consotensis]|nr:hypothetical protein [Tistlia consotensis]